MQMSAPGTVFYKSSGELLAEGNDGNGWTPQGVNGYADKLASLYRQRETLDLQGIMTVSGAGNIARGDQLGDFGLAPRFKDAVGRLATMQNTLVIADALDARKVPYEIVVAPNMAYKDEVLDLPPYEHGRVRKAIEDDNIILIAGGTGTDGNTTDGAVMWYAQDHRRHDGQMPVTVLKGTNVDGVYEGDPRKNANVARYSHIAAETMIRNYEKFKVVDLKSLKIAVESGLNMHLYRDAAHDIGEVLDPESQVGTIIHGKFVPSQFAA